MERHEIQEILTDAIKSARLSSWERGFVESLMGRSDSYTLSDAQIAKVQQIEEKIYAAG